MKKFLLIAVAAFGMLMTACSKDEVAQPVAEKSVVTFTVEAPVMQTRATEHGDGKTATELNWAVYDKGGKYLFGGKEDAEYKTPLDNELKAIVEIPFVNGMAYNILFWAEAPGTESPYKVDWDNLKVGYKDVTDLDSNSQAYDAFYCYFTELVDEITGPVNKNVVLKRPFAQLNIITNDAKKAEQSGLVVKNVAVTVEKGYNAFDFVSGNGININQDAVTFRADAAQAVADTEGVQLLAVNYLFTGGEKSLVDVTFAYTDGNLEKGGNASGSAEYATVPVQRNYRTNIVGSLLTSDGKFNIEIKPGFDGEQGVVDGNNYIKVATAEELNAALNDLTVDEIILEEDVVLSEPLIIGGTTRAETEAVVRNLTIDGNGKTLTSSAARAINVSGVDGVTIKNLTIECSGERAINIIQKATNVTIENVTATAANYTVNVAASAPEAVVAIKNSTLNGLCTVNVAAAGAEVTVDDCTVNCNDNNTTEGESYAALSLNKDAVGGTITVTNSTIYVQEDSDSMIARNGAEDGEITIDGSTDDVTIMVAAITYEGSDYYHAFETLEAAIEAVKEGETISLTKDITFSEGVNGSTNGISYTGGKSFTLDLKGKTVTSDLGNIALRFKIGEGNEVTNAEVTINIVNGKIVSGDNNWCAISAAVADNSSNKLTLNLENLDVENNKAGDYAVKAWAGAVVNAENVDITSSYGGGFYAVGGELVLDNCTVNQKGLHTSPYMSMAVAVSGNGKATVNSGTYTTEPKAASDGFNQGTSHGSWAAGVMNSGGELIINGGTFANGNVGDDALATAARGLIFGDTGSKIVINDGVFNALKNIIDYQNNLGAQPNPYIVINGGDFSADPTAVTSYGGVVVAEGKVAVQQANGRWTLKEGVTTAEALVEAVTAGDDVVLGADITVSEPVVIPEGKTVTLDLNGKAINAAETTGNHIYALKNYGTLTITDSSNNGSINSRGIYNYSSLTLNSGKISAIDGNGGYAVNNQSGSTFIMNGGWIAADYEDGDAPATGNYDATALNVPSNSEATLNSGKITNAGNFTFAISSAGTLNIPASSTLTIEGRHGAISVSGGLTTIDAGTYSIPENTESTDNVVYTYGSGKITINGGTFIGDNDVPNGGTCVYDSNGGVTINGGTFGHSSGGDVWGTTGTVIKGGTFENLTETSYIAEGYKLVNGRVVAE